ncbi:hypothetical protein [Leptothoe kymatousa]|uniref:ATP synthase F0 subunit 8 n=1 Tax=Leptothoe kymatousa TAU-MAC 1615 TaxID=2364775 RepID=A0ABS5Y1R8_9CYAN|nr:hypothetical protein [Leptothoe kymatousa]MBT9311768.1 hypothetical protein [Leptothoe kymatousa TAU-MAC 1615]
MVLLGLLAFFLMCLKCFWEREFLVALIDFFCFLDACLPNFNTTVIKQPENSVNTTGGKVMKDT